MTWPFLILGILGGLGVCKGFLVALLPYGMQGYFVMFQWKHKPLSPYQRECECLLLPMSLCKLSETYTIAQYSVCEAILT